MYAPMAIFFTFAFSGSLTHLKSYDVIARGSSLWLGCIKIVRVLPPIVFDWHAFSVSLTLSTATCTFWLACTKCVTDLWHYCTCFYCGCVVHWLSDHILPYTIPTSATIGRPTIHPRMHFCFAP